MTDINTLNNKIGDTGDEGQRWSSWIFQLATIIVSGGMLSLVIYETYNNSEKERLNPFNSNKEGREYSKLSGLFFTLLPLLTAKVLYHIYVMIVGPKTKQEDNKNGKAGAEKGKFKTLRHIIGLFILIAVAGCLGLIVHPSPDYCFDHTLKAADSKMYELHNLGANETLVNGGRIDLKKHLKKCNVSGLIYETTDSQNNTSSDRYGEHAIENVNLLLVGAITLRFFGVFSDYYDPREVIKFTDPDDINIIKFVILLGASLMSVLAVNIAKDEDLLEKDHTGKQLVEDWFFLDVFIVFAWFHFGFLALGLLIQLFKNTLLQTIKVFLINNIPLARALIVTGTIVAVAYTVGTAAILHIDYSFLSIALVSQVVLDVFGRDKKDAIA